MKFELKPAINRLEDAIITMSGPALAISGIIAGVDLVTGGNMLKAFAWLALVWAICLLLTLDFQVLALGARAHKVYLSKNKETGRKVFEIILAVLVAGAISYVSIQMQSIIARSNSAGLDIATATAQLGINPLALIWERSALVLVLIFLSGWFREGEDETASVSPETAMAISDETMQLILARLAKVDELERTITEVRETPVALLETGETEALEAQISALLAVKDDLSSREVASIVGRPHSTVYRALARVKQAKQ